MRRLNAIPGAATELSEGWLMAGTAPGEREAPGSLAELDPVPARVPGAVAGALAEAGRAPGDLDDQDWWFWTTFSSPALSGGEEAVVWLDGLATVADVFLDGELVVHGESMFARHSVPVGAGGEHELALCFRALGPLLAVRRKPRARWRTRLVSEANLRFFRTMLIGRAPGFAPGPPVVGPWRSVLLDRRAVVVRSFALRTAVNAGGSGVVRLAAGLDGPAVERAELRVDGLSAELSVTPDGLVGELTIPDVELWWPHTHGAPRTYPAELVIAAGGHETVLDVGRLGFRTLEAVGELEQDGLALRVNGVPVFARGAVWTPLEPGSTDDRLRELLELVRSAGMNMLRVPGIACYESPAFYDMCDELGILVWQDFMFANLDYPESDPDFMAVVEAEARDVLDELGWRPSLAVLCGGSEVAQQVAMMGLDPALASGPLYGELLPRVVEEAGVDAPYVPSTPWGGDLPFRPDRGVANYYGVGAYLRPLTDARLADVRFAGECLAFSNVADAEALDALDAPGGLVVHHPRWKQGVPRDAGAGWDFEDVRDHYLKLVFGLDPVALRSVDHERYLELSRQVTGEVMAEVFGEWRRGGSPCGGGLVLWLTDLQPGAGWGVVDHLGRPKVALHHLSRALASVAVWSTDEGLSGVHAHVANDGPVDLAARLRVSLYRDLEIPVEEAVTDLPLAAHDTRTIDVEGLLGRFVDASWAYRFGPPGHDVIVFTLEAEGVFSQSCRFIGTHPTRQERADKLGVSATLRTVVDGLEVVVRSQRLLYGARLSVPGWAPEDDAFMIEPGHERVIHLRRLGQYADAPGGALTALNLAGRLPLTQE